MNVMGKLKAIVRHPVAAGLGYMGGQAAGGYIGGTLGAIGGAKVVDSLGAMREIRKAGGPPDVTGEMKQFDAQPSGKPLERGAKPDPTVRNELIQALKSQGLDSKAATAAAIRAIQKNPKGDFGQLFSDAIRRPDASQPLDPRAATANKTKEADTTGFKQFFQGARPGDAFAEQAFKKLQSGGTLNFADKAGSLESKLQRASDSGKIKTLEDVKSIMAKHYGTQ